MTVKSNVNAKTKKPSFVKELSGRELDMVVGGLNPQPLPPRQIRF